MNLTLLSRRVLQCTLCPSSFSLSHQLRSHHAADHSPPGTKPFPCTQPDCDKSFPTAQKLRQHAKMHDGQFDTAPSSHPSRLRRCFRSLLSDTRYLCTHPSHPSAGLSFPTWSLLRTHINTAHPPSCPYDECKGRPPFKTKKGLKAHLKVHMEREEDDRLLGKEKDQPESDEGDGERRGRKRLRGHGVNDDEDREGAPRPMKKVRRRSVSVAGKDWFCEQGECGKGFKSVGRAFLRLFFFLLLFSRHLLLAFATFLTLCPISSLPSKLTPLALPRSPFAEESLQNPSLDRPPRSPTLPLSALLQDLRTQSSFTATPSLLPLQPLFPLLFQRRRLLVILLPAPPSQPSLQPNLRRRSPSH